MLEPRRDHRSRGASLAAAIALLALCLVLLGSHVTAAQDPSHSPESSRPNSSELRSIQQVEYDLAVAKWNVWDSNYARPGGVFVYGIFYQNLPSAPAAVDNVTITDYLPPGTTYVGDTSGLPLSYDEALGIVTWDLGTLVPGESGVFVVTIGIPPETLVPSVIDPNQVAIVPTADDLDTGNNEAAASPVEVLDGEVEIGVQKRPEPGDPTPGQEFQYAIEWCNNRDSAAGPVMLTDTLPVGTHFVDWTWNPEGQRFWNEVSRTDSQLVLEAPGLPGEMCQELAVVLRVDEAVEFGTTLDNLVEIHAEGDVNFRNDYYVDTEAHVSPPRADLTIHKQFNGGQLVVPGGWIEFAGSYRNQGNVAVNAWLNDTLPEHTTYRTGSAHLGEVQVDPTTTGPGFIEWDLGTVGVNEEVHYLFIVDIAPAALPESTLTNCIEIGHDQPETSPWDNTSCAGVQIFGLGPNLHVEKWSRWNQEEISYTFFAANVGTELASNVFVTDTYPVGTTAAEEPGVPEHLREKTTVSSPPGQWVFQITELQPGESGWFDFAVSVLDPEARPAEFVNSIEIDSDPPLADVNSIDNFDMDTIILPEVDRVNLWLEPDGQSNMWGEAQPGVIVTVTTPAPSVYTTTVGAGECPNCWGIEDTGIVNPGDSILVEAGEGLMPVTVEVPDPFTAGVDRAAGTVSGEIGGWFDQPVEVRGWWDGGWQLTMTDGAGAYEATYADPIPPGAEGAVYFENLVNYTQVGYFRHFSTPWMRVNYGHDWAGANYPLGHTFVVTVTESDEETVKGIAVAETTPDGGWEGAGFQTVEDNWIGAQPDIIPGDFVLFATDGYSHTVRVGIVDGTVDVAADTVSGPISVPWFDVEPDDLLDVECHLWGGSEYPEPKHSTAGPDGDPEYSCDWGGEWDIVPGQEIGVMYIEPDDGDRVINVLPRYYHVYLPIIVRNH